MNRADEMRSAFTRFAKSRVDVEGVRRAREDSLPDAAVLAAQAP